MVSHADRPRPRVRDAKQASKMRISTEIKLPATLSIRNAASRIHNRDNCQVAK
jgi:hypothetical protein